MNLANIAGLSLPLVLASQSPRRKNLLDNLGFSFEVVVADIDENVFDENLEPSMLVQELALRKAREVAYNLTQSAVVLGADTIVVLDGKILNKPCDELDAERMLRMLSNRTHTVFTGIAFVESNSKKHITAVQATEVTFRQLEAEEIKAYIATGSPMDKAGAYGIQDDFGAVFVSNVSGCYYNIVGLPLELTYRKMKEFVKLL